jgi:hypothetical protein
LQLTFRLLAHLRFQIQWRSPHIKM